MDSKPFIRKIVLILGDIACPILATKIAMYIEWGTIISSKTNFHWQILPLLIMMILFTFSIYGLFSLSRKHLTEIFLNLIVAMINVYFAVLAVTFMIRDFDYSRVVLLESAVMTFIFLYIWQYVMHRWEIANIPTYKLVLFAKIEEQFRLSNKIEKYSFTSRLFAVSDGLQDASWQDKINNCYHVLIGETIATQEREKIINYAKSTKRVVFLVPTFYEICCRNIMLYKVDDLPIHRVSRFLLTAEQRVLKRSLDIFVSIVALTFFSPIFIIVAAIIKMDSPGPVIYSQKRVGRFGAIFFVHKFRSMHQNAEALTGPVLACEGDPRITKFGRFMRATRIDELPQLFNVLVGEMSIVGPRPERPIFVEKYIKERPEYAYRLNVRPGITGLAQIFGKYNTTAYDKLTYDLIYIQNVSLSYDLTLMLKTLTVLITKDSTEGVRESSVFLKGTEFEK